MRYRLLLILSLIALPINAIAQQPACPASLTHPRGEVQLITLHRNSVFKVYVGQMPVGTATLIDTRGYFLTASHILDNTQPEFAGNGPWQGPYRGTLRLVSSSLGNLELIGNEVARRLVRSGPDLSLVYAPLPERLQTLIPVVDPFIDWPTPSDRVVMIGFPLAEPDSVTHPLTPIGQIKANTLMVVAGSAFSGESGSVAISSKGHVVGILRGQDPQQASNLLFTIPIADLKIFGRVPPSKQLEHFLASLKTGRLDPTAMASLRAFGFSNLELYQMYEAVAAEPVAFEKGLTNYGRDIYRLFFCNQLEDATWRFAQLVRAKLAAHQLFQAGRTALTLATRLKALPDGQALASERYAGALEFFDAYEKNPTFSAARIPGANRSYFLSLYAKALYDYGDLEPSEARPEKVTSKLVDAITYDRGNWAAYWLLSAELQKHDHELAAKATASALRAAKTSYSLFTADTVRLTVDWTTHIENAIAVAETLAQRVKLNRYLELGVLSAPGLNDQDLKLLKSPL